MGRPLRRPINWATLRAMGQLYRLDFPSGKSYVGISSKSATVRFKGHCRQAGYGSTALVHRAIRKYGEDSVKVQVLANFPEWEGLALLEVLAIEKHQTLNPSGYNLTVGGDGSTGYKHTEESRLKMAKRMADPHEVSKIVAGVADMKADAQRSASHLCNLQLANGSEASRSKKAASAKLKYADPVIRAKMVANLRSPEKVLLASSKSRDLWKDPEYRARQMAARIRKA